MYLKIKILEIVYKEKDNILIYGIYNWWFSWFNNFWI